MSFLAHNYFTLHEGLGKETIDEVTWVMKLKVSCKVNILNCFSII